MKITRVKYWNKVVQNETIYHVEIDYTYDNKHMNMHEYENNSKACDEFYEAMQDFSVMVARACNFQPEMADKITLREIRIVENENKYREVSTFYILIFGIKSGVTITTAQAKVNNKSLPEGFSAGVEKILIEAERYIEGERAHQECEPTELDLSGSSQEPEVDDQEELFYNDEENE